MAKFIYNKAKNASTGHMFFELSCGYHFCVSYEEDIDHCSKLKSANELSTELQELMVDYMENLYHAQKLQKQAYDKAVKCRGYVPYEKVWLNSKYIKTKIKLQV